MGVVGDAAADSRGAAACQVLSKAAPALPGGALGAGGKVQESPGQLVQP